MKTENDYRCDKRINQLEEALRNIANGDMRTSRAKAKMALEGTFPPVDEKPEQEERINKLEEQLNVMRFLFNQAAKELESEQVENHKLRCALSHIVDWCPEPSDYVKDEYIRLFRNAIATARELLSKCSAKEGK